MGRALQVLSRVALLALVCAGCSTAGNDEVVEAAASPAAPALSAPTVDPADYLAPWVCPDGHPEMVRPGCGGSRPTRPDDVQRMRFRDLPGSNSGPEGYQVGGGWTLGNGRYAAVWSYSPWREWTLPHDGGEIYAHEGDRVRVVATQDGGKPYLQVFQGPECGADGWLLFKTDVKPGVWTSVVARLSIGKVGDQCHPMGHAYTRYRIEDVPVTFTHDGVAERYVVRTIIVQHYDHATIAESHAMEEFHFGYHVGRWRWSAYTRGSPAGADLAMRCPERAYGGEPGFTLSDCRDLTNLRSDDEAMSGARYGWPPASP